VAATAPTTRAGRKARAGPCLRRFLREGTTPRAFRPPHQEKRPLAPPPFRRVGRCRTFAGMLLAQTSRGKALTGRRPRGRPSRARRPSHARRLRGRPSRARRLRGRPSRARRPPRQPRHGRHGSPYCMRSRPGCRQSKRPHRHRSHRHSAPYTRAHRTVHPYGRFHKSGGPQGGWRRPAVPDGSAGVACGLSSWRLSPSLRCRASR
jgi:hypothetical protein